jgi:hypothetical protein
VFLYLWNAENRLELRASRWGRTGIPSNPFITSNSTAQAMRLFVPQSRKRIYPQGAEGRDEAGCEHNDQQDNGNTHEGQRISSTDAN